MKFIGNYTFENCTNLKSVTFSGEDTDLTISPWAFQGCTGLTGVTLSAGLWEEFDNMVFLGCDNLKNINISPDSKYYRSVDGVLFSKDLTELVAFPVGRTGAYTVPAQVKNVRQYAFSTSLLEQIVFPEGITKIDYSTFSGCPNLKGFTIPGTVTTLEGGAFTDCPELRSITIPAGVTKIETEVFSRCMRLEKIQVSPENRNYASRDGVLFNKSMTELISFPGAYRGSYTVPDKVESIEYHSFENCVGLTEIRFPNSLTYIGTGSFAGCTGLESLTIPGSVIAMESSCFERCTNLKQVTILNGAKYIDNAFAGCVSLERVKLPASLLEIRYGAFAGCVNLKEITLPKNLQKIDSCAFEYCEKLTEVAIPQSVTYIGALVFRDCKNLRTVTMPDTVEYMDFSVFSGCPVTSIALPRGITEIGSGMFRDCTRLTSVTIPASVTMIDGSAFQNCSSLREVNFEGSRAQWNSIDISLFNDPLRSASVRCDYVRPAVEAPSVDVHFSLRNEYINGQFSDVSPDAWYVGSVKSAYAFGLMKGNSATTFAPNGYVTIAEAVTMAARIHSIYTTGGESFYLDPNKWYQAYFEYAYENDIITAEYFYGNVNARATRAQCAEIFANALPDEALSERNHIEDGFIPDVKPDHKYAASIYKLYRAGVLTGGNNFSFDPASSISRAEAAAIVSRMADSDNRIRFTA